MTKSYSLKVLFRLVPPSFTCISTSARSLPEKLDLQLPLEVLCRFMTLTTPTHLWVFNSQGPPTRELTLVQTESCLKKKQKWSPLHKVKGPFSSLVCTRKQKNGPSSAYQAFSIASCNSRHALSPRGVHPTTSPCPTLSANTEPIFKMDCANW